MIIGKADQRELLGGEAYTSPLISLGFQHLCLAVDNVDETLAALREKGVQVAREPFDVPPIGKRCGFITDLQGNVIEFAANLN